MSRIRVSRLIPFEVQYECDECEDGYMISTGKYHPTKPPKIEHKCEKCGDIIYLEDKYPKVEFIHERLN
jgi:hypothetical protein